MMSHTMTPAGCLIPTQCRAAQCLTRDARPAALLALAHWHRPLQPCPASGEAGCRGGRWPHQAGPGARGPVGERVMSRAAVGGSPGGEAQPGEFSGSSAAFH